MDASLRMARKYSRNFEIVTFWGGFHGRSYGPMSVTGLAKIKKHFGPMVPGTILAPYATAIAVPSTRNTRTATCSAWTSSTGSWTPSPRATWPG